MIEDSRKEIQCGTDGGRCVISDNFMFKNKK